MAGFIDWTPPTFSPTSIPTLPALSLTVDEKHLIEHLQRRQRADRKNLILCNSYYMGAQIIDNLKIAIPEELALRLRTLVGWPRIAVDPYVERLSVEGFRLPGETDINTDLQDLWHENGLDAEFPMATTDALSMGRAYWLVGSPLTPGDAPRITVESPLNMTVGWDLSGRRVKVAMQSYMVDNQRHSVLLLPGRTIELVQDEFLTWQLVNRVNHGFEHTGVVRMANNPRTDNRDGYSEITPELMSIVDGACRTLLGLEVARELYSVPQKLLLGASETDFQNPNGEVRKAWDTYINHILALERDDEGNLPEVKQLVAYDPATFTKLIEMYASQASGILAADPRDLGLYTEGNPVSTESAQVSEGRRDRRARRKQDVFGVPLVEVAQTAQRFMNDGDLPDRFKRMAVDWADVAIRNDAVTADMLTKYIGADVLPARSDVTLKRAGFSAVERQQIEQDRGEQVPNDIVTALQNAATSTRQPAQPAQVTSGDGASTAG